MEAREFSIMSLKVDKSIHQKFKALCQKRNTKIVKEIERVLNTALEAEVKNGK